MPIPHATYPPTPHRPGLHASQKQLAAAFLCLGTLLPLGVAAQQVPGPSEFTMGSLYWARYPYTPNIGGIPTTVDIATRPRRFDFGGAVPIVNPDTGVPDFATINTWNDATQRSAVHQSANVTNTGIPLRLFKDGKYTAVVYDAGDGLVEGALRTQLNSYPISTRQRYVWDLKVHLGGARSWQPWKLLPRNQSPATIWQLKSAGVPPAMVIVADTDPADATKLMIHIDARPDSTKPSERLGQIGGLDLAGDHEILIDGNLDDRTPAQGGEGRWRVWINGTPVVNKSGSPTINYLSPYPPQWSMGVYMYANTTPLNFSRGTFWERARMFSVDFGATLQP